MKFALPDYLSEICIVCKNMGRRDVSGTRKHGGRCLNRSEAGDR